MVAGGGTALITGASSGIGAAFARALAARGFHLILVARRVDRLELLARELSPCKVNVETLTADLAVDADVAAVERRISEAQDLELLINNAGFGTRGRFFESAPESQEAMHRLHVLATMRLTRAALAGMVARDRGGVINVSSVAGFAATPGNVSYCSTKAWMNSFTEGLALELAIAGSRVRVQALCPGFTYTEFHDVMKVDRNQIPRGWWMKPEQVVSASLKGLEAGKSVVVPGLRYRALALAMRSIPRFLLHPAVKLYARRMKRV
ncbi:MAG: SDR family NAD(P)-dependent oxidoreductase [Bryobacteraceae bacterium]